MVEWFIKKCHGPMSVVVTNTVSNFRTIGSLTGSTPFSDKTVPAFIKSLV